MNLELRNRIYHATLLVPIDVRDVIGQVRFRQTLDTSNRREAELLAAPYIARWKAQIRQARGQTNAVQIEALRWKNELDKADTEGQLAAVEDFLIEKTKKIEETAGKEQADDFWGVATSTRTPSNILLDQWKAQLTLAEKTKEQMLKDVDKFIARFPTLEGVTEDAAHAWAWNCIEKKENTESSMGRVLAFSRNYWRYLQKMKKVKKTSNPLIIDGISRESRKGRNTKKAVNLPYSVTDVIRLYEAALAGWGKRTPANPQLANLIKIGAYTGARIEELCSLKCADVHEDHFVITEAKTGAGIREVPTHSQITGLMKSLKDASKDGYLLSGLTFNKYKDRSNAIGKSFGRLKKSLGFGDDHEYTFHSFRSTLITMLENAGVSEGITADIVGHEKQTITFGLYSGGNQLAVMREAIEKVKYPFTYSTPSP